MGMTENAINQAFYRFRQRYQTLLREEIAHTVAMPKDVEDELRHSNFGITSVIFERIFRSTSEEGVNGSRQMARVLRICRKCGDGDFGRRTGRTLRRVRAGDESWNAPRRS